MRANLPGNSKPIDVLIAEACLALGVEPWGGQSDNGWSKNADFLRCPYRYYLKYISRSVPVVPVPTSSSLDIGSCCHLLLAAHYARCLPDERYPGWRAFVPEPIAFLEAMETAGLPLVISTEVRRLYEGYVEKYADENLSIVAVEMPVGDPNFHTSRYDLVFYIEDGIHDGLWIGEHKTMAPVADIEEFDYDGEVVGEMLSWTLSDLDSLFDMSLNGICINGLIKAKPLPRYQRRWIPFNPDQVAEFAFYRKHWLKQMLECYNSKLWPKSMQGCKARYSKCRFWEHCKLRDHSKLVVVR